MLLEPTNRSYVTTAGKASKLRTKNQRSQTTCHPAQYIYWKKRTLKNWKAITANTSRLTVKGSASICFPKTLIPDPLAVNSSSYTGSPRLSYFAILRWLFSVGPLLLLSYKVQEFLKSALLWRRLEVVITFLVIELKWNDVAGTASKLKNRKVKHWRTAIIN